MAPSPAPAAERLDLKLKQHITDYPSDEDEDFENPSLYTQDDASNSSSRSRTGSKQQSLSVLQASSHKVTEHVQARTFVVNHRFNLLRSLPGGFPVFDDAHPDPGCEFEAIEYRSEVDPVFIPPEEEAWQKKVEHPTLDHPLVQWYLEEAREAHWKMHDGQKGFERLKGIPELQQLLAYTAAYVVDYAVGRSDLGAPGQLGPPLTASEQQHREKFHSRCLSDGSSLIGQLCPALRLCLAAEVATGLLCDSQPCPPDTPQHASALLLFLAAALRQAEQECAGPFQQTQQQQQQQQQQGGIWALNPTLDGLRYLIDFVSCPDPVACLRVLQDTCAPSSLRASDAVATSSSSSSSSSRRSEAITAEDCMCLTPVVAAVEIALTLLQQAAGATQQQRQQSVAGTPDFAVGSALPEAAAAADNINSSSCSSSSSNSSTTQGGAISAAALTAQLLSLPRHASERPAAAAAGAAGAASAAASPGSQQQQQEQLLQGRAVGVDDLMCQLTTFVDTSINTVLLQQQPQQQQQQQLSRTCDALSASTTTTISGSSSSSSDRSVAEEVSLAIAAFTGGFAVKLFFESVNVVFGTHAEHSDPAAAQAAAALDAVPACLQQLLVVQAALLATEVQALQGAVLDSLERARWGMHLHAHPTATQQQQQQGLHRPPCQPGCIECRGGSWADAVKSEVTQRVLQVMKLAHSFQEAAAALAASAAAAEADADAGAGSVSGQQQQQQHGLSGLVISSGIAEQWFADAFKPLAGQQQPQQQQQQQLSPVCLHPAAHLLQRAAAAAGAAAPEGISEPQLELFAEAKVCWPKWVGQVYADTWFRVLQCNSAAAPAAAAAAAESDIADAASSSSSSSQDPLQQLLQLLELAKSTAAAAAAGQDPVEGLVSNQMLASCLILLQPLLKWQIEWLHNADNAAHHVAAELDWQVLKEYSAQHSQVEAQALIAEHVALERQLSKQERRWSTNETAVFLTRGGRKITGRFPPCQLCKSQAAAGGAGGAAGEHRQSSSSSSGYSGFPVPWSDAFMMRRLLWDLLGRIKPTAQKWFKTHARMCPHRTDASHWHMVTMSIARHIWAPTGPWTLGSQKQLALVLPVYARRPRQRSNNIAAMQQQLARSTYARSQNVAFAQQHSQGQLAALLSMHALLALDPHGARVQPHQELLYYTPAGFHVAVCKTLMQTLKLPAQVQQQQHEQQLPQPQKQQQQQQQQCDLLSQPWSQAAFPAWYVWWHIGLLAYRIQQQQQTGSERDVADANGTSSSSSGDVPLSLHNLYSSAEARMYAVGYAARQLSSVQQLQALMNNPPLPHGLMAPPDTWLGYCSQEVSCKYCKAKYKPPAQGLPALCTACSTLHLQHCPSCVNRGLACRDMHHEGGHAYHWRLLGLLKPSYTAQQQQQQQQEEEGKGAYADFSMPACIPPDVSCGLSDMYRHLTMKQRVAGFHTGNQGLAQQQQQQQAASSVQRWFSLLPGVPLQDRPPWGLRGGPDKSTGQLQKAEDVLAVLRQQLRTEEMLEMIQMRRKRHRLYEYHKQECQEPQQLREQRQQRQLQQAWGADDLFSGSSSGRGRGRRTGLDPCLSQPPLSGAAFGGTGVDTGGGFGAWGGDLLWDGSSRGGSSSVNRGDWWGGGAGLDAWTEWDDGCCPPDPDLDWDPFADGLSDDPMAEWIKQEVASSSTAAAAVAAAADGVTDSDSSLSSDVQEQEQEEGTAAAAATIDNVIQVLKKAGPNMGGSHELYNAAEQASAANDIGSDAAAAAAGVVAAAVAVEGDGSAGRPGYGEVGAERSVTNGWVTTCEYEVD